MSRFVDWLKTEWDALERRQSKKYSTRRLSMEAGLSPNTLYQLLNHPEVKPSPETCHKLAEFFEIEPLMVLEIAGHVSSGEVTQISSELEAALQRDDLRKLLLTAQSLPALEVQLVQQMVDRLRVKYTDEDIPDVAKGVAVALVVEDTPDSRALYAHMLRTAGLKVLEAKDGLSAVELIETSGEAIDVVLMDYRMPRMDGIQATKKIREHFPELPILFVSGWDEPEMKEAAFKVGAVDYLVSPIDYEELIEVVSRVRQR